MLWPYPGASSFVLPAIGRLRSSHLFQGFAYLVMIGVANLCYYLGQWSERLVRPANVAGYRKIIFGLGFWFSVLLPFIPSALLSFTCTLHAGQEKRIIL